MSVQVNASQRAAQARSLTGALWIAGPAAIASVSLGAVALGFWLWLSLALRSAPAGFVDDLFLIICVALGVGLTFGAWYAYAVYFSRRAGTSLRTALRWDAVSWLMLAAFPLLIIQPLWPLSFGRCTAATIALWALAKLIAAARFNETVRDVFGTFVVTRVAIVLIAELAYVLVAQRAGAHTIESNNPLLAVWGRWDAVHYIDIANRGYYGTDMAFFPAYPLLIKIVSIFTANALVAGIIVSNVALFFGLLFCYKLVAHMYGRPVAHRTVFYISIFPTAVFFSAAYTESLFFALTVASFYYIRERRWITAGILGALAAMTRVEGILLVVPLLIEAVGPTFAQDRDCEHVAVPARAIAGAAIVPLGLLAYMAILWVIRGDPLYFMHVQAHWNRHLAPPWASVWHAVKEIGRGHPATNVASQAIELSFTVLMIAILVSGFRRLTLSLWSYMALSIVVPMSTSSLMSMPRFALVLFPMFIILALWGERPNVNSAIVAFSLPLLGLFTVLFANWYWVA